MKLQEATESYVTPEEYSGKHANRRIKTFLKAELRKLAEKELDESWDRIATYYRDTFSIEGSPEEGSASLSLKSAQACHGFGSSRRENLRIELPQRELFEV